MIRLSQSPKGYTKDQDKAFPPSETISRVKELLAGQGKSILARTRRIDTGRLDIPVFLSECGEDARMVMPTRKQMGKGASPEQAEASALMELVERYSFFTRWNTPESFEEMSFSEAEKRASQDDALPVIDIKRILQSVNEDLDPALAREIMDLMPWRFHPATNLSEGREESLPLDWFKLLGEFNGSSAGNTHEESIVQGGCELVERHVCALSDRSRQTMPTIDKSSVKDEVLLELIRRFEDNGVEVLLKDMTLGMPVPTVAALCHDPDTFPEYSEIVWTAGTATSPAKAAIRALTEVAQLGGDFETASVYEASGLPKFSSLEETAWLREGPLVPLDSLPDIEADDFRDELTTLAKGLTARGYTLYSVDMSAPSLGLPAHYNLAPGLEFRERDLHACLGLFVGRKLAEDAPLDEAISGLERLAEIYPEAHFIPFFQGMLQLRLGDCHAAQQAFALAEPLQPDEDNKALAAFYNGYSLTQNEDWGAAVAPLSRAIELCSEHKEFYNLRGVARFKQQAYAEAAEDFRQALALDKGSAMDLANLGLCHKFMGNTEQAREYLSAALEVEPALDFARQHLDELVP